jgi:hypothetical protein
MTDGISIRRVRVEFLRPGPSHNQLLSPYTQYLAICNDAGAAVVTVPYEQRVFERRLKELRYETGDQSDRLDMLHEIGRDMGRILESVPGFTGALTHDAGSSNTLVHLRLTLSAAELALLPFELAEVPVGATSSAVSIQTRPPVSVTRHIRTVSSEGLTWPDCPRILFVSADPQDVPFAAHRDALVRAIAPFQYPTRDDATLSQDGRVERVGDLLTILVRPTLVELQQECESAAYTHIHILTHGDLDLVGNESYGIVLRADDGSSDVVSGDRFVSAITRLGHRPAVVTIASCDSGNVGSVVVPGASFAHAVHQAGIPLVVGSQFPLSKPGSVPMTSRLYQGLLWGEHPLHVLHQVRSELHARFNTNWHDWASMVVYEALPPSLNEQLDVLSYTQARRATNAALERIDLAVASSATTSLESLVAMRDAVGAAVERLPLRGQFAVECVGLRASSRKRLAQAAFTLAAHTKFVHGDPFADPFDLLDQARLDYGQAVRGLLVNDVRAVQRKATLHWVLVQFVSLGVVLEQRLERGEWETARLAAEHYRDHSDHDERAWAHASLAELWVLALASPDLSDEERAECVAKARKHAEELNACYPGVDAFPVKSTRRQFERYVDWWGTKEFGASLTGRGLSRRGSWDQPAGLVATATQLIDLLSRRKAGPPPGSAPVPPPVATSAQGGSSGSSGAGLAAPTEASAAAVPRTDPSRGSDRPFFTIEALPAGHGDCLWIEYGDDGSTHRVLIDCGTQATSKALLARVDAMPEGERFLELFVLSHIDSDHIGGALPFFKAVKSGLRFGDVWYNGWRHISGQLGARQGEMFSSAILDFELPWNVWRAGASILTDDDGLPEHVLPGGMRLTLLSPTRERLNKLAPIWTRELKRYGLTPGAHVDYAKFLKGTPSTIADAAALQDIDGLADVKFGGDNGAPNGTSIALLAEFGGASALLAADAHAPVLEAAIGKLLAKRGGDRLKLDLFKVSHHGSQNNVSSDLIRKLDCSRYLISTNGDHFYHPDRQAIARILKYGGDRKELFFNYNSTFNQVWGDAALASVRERYNCSTTYPSPDQQGIVVPLL